MITLVLTAMTSKGNLTILSSLVAIAATLLLCIESIALMRGVDDRRNADEMMENIRLAADTYFSDNANHRFTVDEATGIKMVITPFFPRVAKNLKISEITGHTQGESIEIIRQNIKRNSSKRIWKMVIFIVITMIGGILIGAAAAKIDGGGRSRRNSGSSSRVRREHQRVSGHQRGGKYHSRRR